jgi:hypothetical protein
MLIAASIIALLMEEEKEQVEEEVGKTDADRLSWSTPAAGALSLPLLPPSPPRPLAPFLPRFLAL